MRFVTAALAALSLALIVLAAPSAWAQPIGQKTSSLYVRGDIGGAFSTHTEFADTNGTATNASLGSTQLAGDSGNSLLIQAGLGLQLNSLLRFDVTVMSLPMFKFNTTNNATPKGGVTYTTINGMVNGYLELNKIFRGLFGSAEPYFDGGVGLAYNQVNHFSYTDTSGNTTVLAQNEHFDPAWAAGAGIGFPLTKDLKIDVAYRYLFLGNLESGNSKVVNGQPAVPTTQAKANLQAHTVMIGLRYGFYAFNAF